MVPFANGGAGAVDRVRSTLLASSLHAIRERDLFDRYQVLLPERYHEQVIHTLAPVWLPIEVAVAHYNAVDALQLDDRTVYEIGRSVGDRLQGTFLGTIARGAQRSGVTPWAILNKMDRVWGRIFEGGGGCAVFKLGPKEARAEVRGLPLVRCAYFRQGFRGVLAGGLEVIARKCYVNLQDSKHHDGLNFVVSWV